MPSLPGTDLTEKHLSDLSCANSRAKLIHDRRWRFDRRPSRKLHRSQRFPSLMRQLEIVLRRIQRYRRLRASRGSEILFLR